MPASSQSTILRRYDPDASIVFIGLQGSGKSTLAVITASALRFRLVDVGDVFYKVTGKTTAAYAAIHGSAALRLEEVEQTCLILQRYPKRTVLVLGLGSVEEHGQLLVRNFARDHPVIFILRDAYEAALYLGSTDAGMVAKFGELSAPTYRRLSNFEFYNLSDSPITIREDSTERTTTSQTYLPLKNVEHDLLRLIASIRGQQATPPRNLVQHSTALVPPESRPFSYCLQLSITQVDQFINQIRLVDVLSDVVELVIPLTDACSTGRLEVPMATNITRQYYSIRRAIDLPVVVHINVQKDDQLQSPLFRTAYLEIVDHILRLAPDYLTLDFHLVDKDIDTVIRTKGLTKIIGHYTMSISAKESWEHPQLPSVLQRMLSSSCAMARIVQQTDSETNDDGLQAFLDAAKLLCKGQMSVIAYSTGSQRQSSRWRNRIFSPVQCTHLEFQDSKSKHLPTIQDINDALFSSRVLEPQVFGIFGDKVLQSASPLMYNAAFKLYHMPHRYLPLQSNCIEDLKVLFQQPNFGGASITSPFKREVLGLMTHLSPAARAIGAINTVLALRSPDTDAFLARHKTGQLHSLFGDNTDWIGVYTSIQQHLSPVNAIQPRTTALILGAGGMAHAAAYSMMRLGIQTIFIANRTLAHAQALADKFRDKNSLVEAEACSGCPSKASLVDHTKFHALSSLSADWPETAFYPTIIVSCIPGITSSGPTNITIPNAWLRSKTGGVVIELAYNPAITPLLTQVRAMKEQRWVAVAGLDVLPEQAFAQFELFTGRKAPEHLMREKVFQRHRELYKMAVRQHTK